MSDRSAASGAGQSVPRSNGEAWMRYFDEVNLVVGASGNVIDNIHQAFDAGWRACLAAIAATKEGGR